MSKSSEKISFPGSQGGMLAARLDRPDGPPQAYALFAHCFTCSKDILAASRIAGALADRGFAVLRFDFTGLGASEGEFANTNFSSNVEDLLLAVEYLRRNHAAPQILIGHSLGGAAVLAAAFDVPELRAVATIGAPADANHVAKQFHVILDDIERDGASEVTLAGRTFTIKKQFLDDLKQQSLLDRLGQLRKALLVFHAPRDEVVGIENASMIFAAAKHPKSFVSLDGADHLLSRKEDAGYVASVLAAWAARYIDAGEAPRAITTAPAEDGVVIVTETGRGVFQQEVVTGKHRLLADEPESFGGLNTGPSPYDYLAIALGACTTITLRAYVARKGLKLERAKVEVRHNKVHAQDCIDCAEGREGRIDRFERLLDLQGALSEAELHRLVEIADRCPVHRTLEQSSSIVTKLRV
ncbi:MAG: bifunctional alpha/beta hydrolase/OsmC family protein [Hyphomicrobium sp.]